MAAHLKASPAASTMYEIAEITHVIQAADPRKLHRVAASQA
jgi:hypothetical protein